MRASRYFQIFSLIGLLFAGIAISGGALSPVTAADETPATEKKPAENKDEKKEAAPEKPAAKDEAPAKESEKEAAAKEKPASSDKADAAKPSDTTKPIENVVELPKQTLFYNRDIRPILVENCFSCHGPDSASRQAELRLDKRDAAIEKSAIRPGKPDESGAVARIFTLDKDELMPPPDSHKKLTAKQRETIRQWVAEGANYEPHWSFIAPKRPEPPKVKNEKWVRNPIDAFVLRELENRKLTPANEADRRTLARRLSLDLRGIPPTPAEVEEFVNDNSANYYEAYVDRMMASTQWGEHRARYWLDYARYADTHGIHFDNYREMWSYREWLINAFNKNQTYDQFTIDCLAGDLRPNRTVDQQVGSGFNRCHMTSSEGGLIDEEYLVLYDRDRTETTSQVWMGLTMGCCVCHDHKFDPVSQKEFYQFAAFFNNTTQGARDGNIHDTPPIMKVPLAEDRAALKEIAEKINTKNAEIETHKTDVHPQYLAWLKDVKAEQFENTISEEGLTFNAPFNEGKKNTIHYVSNGEDKSVEVKNGFDWSKGQIFKSSFRFGKGGESPTFPEIGDFDSTDSFSYGCWAYIPRTRASASIFARMDEDNDFRGWDLWMEDQKIGVHMISKWPENNLKVMCKTSAGFKNWHHIFVTYDGSQKAAGLKIYINGEIQPVDVHADTLNGTIKTKVPLKVGQRSKTSRADRVQINDMRIYSRVLTNSEVKMLSKANRLKEILAKEESTRSEEENVAMKDWWLNNEDQKFTALNVEVDGLLKIRNEMDSRGAIAYVMQEKMGEAHAYLLKRGEYDQRDGGKLTAGTPSALPSFPENLPKNRLGLAQWLLMPDHPLTSRVAANRIWQEIFGTGIVRTTGDFGVSGELPSHPELLDWLAVEFREGGWDMKKFYKMIVMSATYRQAALTTPEKLAKDPANTYFSRGPRFRMDGEMIRDYLLSASGLLVNKIGGPSVKPYQPEGVWEVVGMAESNTRQYKQDKGDNLYRRSMYSFWKRMAPPSGLEVFNAPNREVCVTRRERTNTPLMALAALNDVQYVEAARVLAQQALSDQGSSLDDKIEFLSKRLLSRSFKPNEVAIVKDSLNELVAFYKDHADDAKKVIKVGEKAVDKTLPPEELAAWTMLVNEMMNLDEVLSK